MTGNLADLVTEAAEAAPDAVALVEAESGRQLTWADLDEDVDRAAAGFAGLGLVAGNRVLLSTAQRVELVVGYFAALRAGLVAVPVNPRSAVGELVRMVADSRARLLVADPSTVDALRPVAAGLREASAATPTAAPEHTVVPRIVGIDVTPEPGEVPWPELTGRPRPARGPAAADPERLAVLLYTSGTTGRPRGAMLTHRALLANLEQVARLRPPVIGPDDVVYGLLPLFHVYGLNAVLGQVARARAALVLPGGFDPEDSLDDIRDHGVTVVPVTPTVLAHWTRVPDLGDRLSEVRTVLCGSAPLPPQLAHDFEARSGRRVHQGYGLTEAAPVVTSTWGRPEKPGSVGFPLPGVRLRLVDDTGRPTERNDPGQILVAGDNLFSGYWPDAEDGPVDGWLATGDLGILDDDGDLFLVDRLKDLVIVSGFNVYPSEVEEVVGEVKGVLEVAVVGEPDATTGEAVVAYVRAEADAAQAPEDLVGRVRQACGMRLARYKHPSRVEVVEELPRSATGGLARGRLRMTVRRERLGLIE